MRPQNSAVTDFEFLSIAVSTLEKRTLPIFQLSAAIGVRPGKNANFARVNLSRDESQIIAERNSKGARRYRAILEMVNCVGILSGDRRDRADASINTSSAAMLSICQNNPN